MVEAGRDFVGHIQEYNLTVNFLIFNIITTLNNRIFLFNFTKDWNPENSTKRILSIYQNTWNIPYSLVLRLNM